MWRQSSDAWPAAEMKVEVLMTAIRDITRGDLERAARDVAEAHGARLVVLFGSAARGDRVPEDLDLGVLADGPLDAVAVTAHFIRLLAVQQVDVTDLARAEPLLLMLVAQEGVPLYQRTPAAFTGFVSLAMRRYADTAKFREAERAEIREFLER